jgi:hypothetical protein
MITSGEIRALLTAKQILDAQEAGRIAFHAGKQFTACPHSVNEDVVPEAVDRVRALQLMWIRGYADEKNRRRYVGLSSEPDD